MKKYAAYAGLVLMGTAMALGFMEGALRLVTPRPKLPIKGYYRTDPDLSYDIQENFPKTTNHSPAGDLPIWSNSLGCFDLPLDPTHEAASGHILLVGDSFTQGGSFEDNWGTRVQELSGARVLKCGVVGYGTKQELLKAGKILAKTRMAPSLIVVGYFMNDLEDDYLFPSKTVIRGWSTTYKTFADYDTGRVAERPREVLEKEFESFEKTGEAVICPSETAGQKIRCWLFTHSRAYHDIKDPLRDLLLKSKALSGFLAKSNALARRQEFVAWMPADKYPWVGKAWDTHLRNLKAFQALARKQNAKLLVVVIPTKEQVYPFLRASTGITYRGDLDTPNRILQAYFKKEKIASLDLLPDFRKYADPTPRRYLDRAKDLYLPLDGHWDEKGHRLAGLLVARRILTGRLIRVPDQDRKLRSIERELAGFR